MKNFNTILALFLLSAATLSCNKKGCSDPTADNYEKRVKKAQNRTCSYNGEGICGEGIMFCMEVNGIKKIGKVLVTDTNNGTTQLLWTNGNNANSPSYEDLQIVFRTGVQEKLDIGVEGDQDKFQASYLFATNLVEATNGSMLIKKNNTSDGIIATFNLTLSNGTQIKKGNIYKAK